MKMHKDRLAVVSAVAFLGMSKCMQPFEKDYPHTEVRCFLGVADHLHLCTMG
jgi:hypothetical protein